MLYQRTVFLNFHVSVIAVVFSICVFFVVFMGFFGVFFERMAFDVQLG